MKDQEVYNWSNPPNHILAKIYHYTHDKFKPNLRLVNKNWSNSVKGEVFYSIGGSKDEHVAYLTNKYGNLVRELYNYNYEFDRFKKYIQSTPLLHKFYLDLSSNPIDKLIELNSINKPIHTVVLCCNGFDDIWISEDGWNRIFELISTIRGIKNIDIFNGSIPIPNSVPSLPINNIKLWSPPDSILSFMNLYKNINTSNLDWTVSYPENPTTFHRRSTIPSPNQLLTSSLKQLRLWIYDYSDNRGPIEPHLASEILDTFKNPHFSTLKSLEWHFWWSPNQTTCKLFNEPIPIHKNKWTNLTKLSLFVIDEYLMTYVIEHCINLEEMNFNSPLVLPKHDDPMSLSPLRSLKKMLFGSLDLQLVDNYGLITHLFPNVVTINLYYIVKTYIVTMDCYHIPFLFPNANFVIFEISQYEFERLINEYEGILNWEELYLTVESNNLKYVNALIEKLPKLKLLYIQYHLEDNEKIEINRKDIKVYRVGDPTPLTYKFYIYDEIK